MEPAGRLPAQEWFTHPETVQVMKALMSGGKPARFVGGCVRDAILGLQISDVDIATPEPPERVITLLHKLGIRVEPIGLAHGSVMAIQKNRAYDITTLRSDVETFGRHARVNYIDDWQQDASRRDFTMNAIYADLDGTLYDPTGGIPDLKAGRVCFIGDPYQRIQEDCLRILRFFRFQAYYGQEPASAEALLACEKEAPYIRGLSAERVWTEFKRLLLSNDPSVVLLLMHQHHILSAMLANPPTEEDIKTHLPLLIQREIQYGVPKNAIRRLACLIASPLHAAKDIQAELPLSTPEYRHLMDLARLLKESPDLSDIYQSYRILYFHGPEIYRDYVLLSTSQEDLERCLDLHDHWSSPAFPLKGKDLLEAGFVEGPGLGLVLKEATDWWLSQACKPGKDECLEWLRARNKL